MTKIRVIAGDGTAHDFPDGTTPDEANQLVGDYEKSHSHEVSSHQQTQNFHKVVAPDQTDPSYIPPPPKSLGQAFVDYDTLSNLADQDARNEEAQGINDLIKGSGVFRRGLGALEFIGGAFDYITVPITAAVTEAAAPIERATGLKGSAHVLGQSVSTAAQMFTGGGEAKALGTGAKSIGKSKIATGVKHLLSPTSADADKTVSVIQKGAGPFTASGARVAELNIRANTGALAQAKEKIAFDLDKFQQSMSALPDGNVHMTEDGKAVITSNSKIAFTNAIETGDLTSLTPDLRPAAEYLRGAFDTWRDKIRGLGKGYLQTAIENYFPHIWKDPQRVMSDEELLGREHASIATKTSLKGKASFLKKRTIGTYVEGLSKGYEPISTNPLDIALIKLHEMQKFYYGNLILDDMKSSGVVKFFRLGARPPEGWVPLDGREFRIFAPALRAETEAGEEIHGAGPQLVGQYYAPDAVARVMRNFMSTGFRGNSVYDAIRSAANGLNQFQLAWPAFHTLFAMQDTLISEMARGVERAGKGELGKAASSLVKGVTLVGPVVEAIYKGGKLRAAVLAPEAAPEEVKQLARALAQGGGRVKMDEFYRASAELDFVRSFKRGTLVKDVFGEFKGHPLSGFPKMLAATLDTIAKPTMDYLVPRAKLGVFYNLAEDFLRRNPAASEMELRDAMATIWDSIDNRLGQMVYDNLFWNKMLKDTAFMAVRSVGWNLGTIREIAGAVPDTARYAHAMMTGKNPEISHRMAYAFMLPIVTGIQGGIITYLTTGKPPQRLLDYWAPPTGGQTPNGAPERIMLPSYMKDVMEFNYDPEQQAVNKLHPMFATMGQVLADRDYFGAMISDPNDPAEKQLTDWLSYYAGQIEPFSIRNYERMVQENQQDGGASALPPWATLAGINVAPGYITDPERIQRYQRQEQKRARKRKAREEVQGYR